MKAFLHKIVPAGLALAGLLVLASPAQAQPGWERGPGYGPAAFGPPGPSPMGPGYGAPGPRGGYGEGYGYGYGDRRPSFHHDWYRHAPDYGYGNRRYAGFDGRGPGPEPRFEHAPGHAAYGHGGQGYYPPAQDMGPRRW